MVAFYTLLVGPQLVRQDLRSDLPNIDLLKTYPLAGWQVVLGEMLAPIAILSGLLWIALAAAAWALGAFSGQVEWLTAGNRLTFVLCLACIVPLLCALELIVPNAAMLVLPGWHQTTRTPGGGGIEMMGQRLIFVFGQVLVVLLMLLPAVVAAALLIFATQWIAGLPAAAVLATLAVLVILGGEAWCWIWWLGRRFEKLDLSMELKNA
jgi:hypothetical protein